MGQRKYQKMLAPRVLVSSAELEHQWKILEKVFLRETIHSKRMIFLCHHMEAPLPINAKCLQDRVNNNILHRATEDTLAGTDPLVQGRHNHILTRAAHRVVTHPHHQELNRVHLYKVNGDSSRQGHSGVVQVRDKIAIWD